MINYTISETCKQKICAAAFDVFLIIFVIIFTLTVSFGTVPIRNSSHV